MTTKRATETIVARPEWLPERRLVGCTEPCDALLGPCACGAWHQPRDLSREDVAALTARAETAAQARREALEEAARLVDELRLLYP
jgi:hypothetical protein